MNQGRYELDFDFGMHFIFYHHDCFKISSVLNCLFSFLILISKITFDFDSNKLIEFSNKKVNPNFKNVFQ